MSLLRCGGARTAEAATALGTAVSGLCFLWDALGHVDTLSGIRENVGVTAAAWEG